MWNSFRKAFFFSLFSGLILMGAPCLRAETNSREIKIIAAVSSSFKQNPEWEKEIRDRILFVNRVFEKQFGIHFSVYRFMNWDPQDENWETNILIQELRNLYVIGPDEIVAGFHKMSKPANAEVMLDPDTVGTAEFFRGYLILRDPFQELTVLQRQVVTLHEISHLFGAIHVGEKDQIMSPSLPSEPPVTLDPENTEIVDIARRVDFQIGITSLSNQEIDRFIQIYEQLIRKNPHSDFYYQLGNFYKIRGLESRAIATWEEALHYQYSNPMIHWELGQYYYKNSRYDAAIRELGASIAFFVLPSQKKQRGQVYNFLGVANYKRGNLDQAIVNWLKGLASDPDSLDLQGNLAAAYMENGDIDRALSELTKLAAKYPDDSTTLSNLGVAYLKKKEFEKAIEYIQKAIDRLPPQSSLDKKPVDQKTSTMEEQVMGEIPEAMLRGNLGAAYLGLKKFDQAISELRQAQELGPDNKEVIQNLMYAQLQNKNYLSVIDLGKEALKTHKENPFFYSFVADAYALNGNIEEAMKFAQAALPYADAELRARLRKNMAVFHAQNKKYDQAIAELKNSLNDKWNDPDTHVKLGYTYGQMGRLEEARRSFQNALRIDPNFTEAKKALDALQGK